MNMKHTPGPWATDEREHYHPHQSINVKATGHRTVCTVWIDDAPDREFNDEQEANACLIAAAPDLLTALQEMCAEFRKLDLPYCSKAYNLATSAINKAAGN